MWLKTGWPYSNANTGNNNMFLLVRRLFLKVKMKLKAQQNGKKSEKNRWNVTKSMNLMKLDFSTKLSTTFGWQSELLVFFRYMLSSPSCLVVNLDEVFHYNIQHYSNIPRPSQISGKTTKRNETLYVIVEHWEGPFNCTTIIWLHVSST